MELKLATIYVDLDSLFDTRAAVMAQFGMDIVEKNITGDYYERVYDEFEDIDPEAWKEAYASRNSNTLREAMVTPVARILHMFGKQTIAALIGSPFRRQPKVVINTYPYKLGHASIEAIISGVKAVTKGVLDIEVITVPLDVLTPSYVKTNYVTMVMYSYWEWLEVHSLNRNLVDEQCPAVTLIGPRLVKSKEAALKLTGQDVFTAIETYAGLFIKLQLHPIDVFCVDIDRIKKQHEAKP